MLVQSSPGRRHREERATRWPITQPRQVRTAWHVCSVGGRPVFHRTRSARAARRGVRARRSQFFETRAADPSRCWCGRAATDGVGRSAPRVGAQHCHLSPHCAARVLRGRSAIIPRGKKRAGRALWGSNATITAFQNPCRRPVVVSGQSSLGQRHGEERGPRLPTTQPRQVSTARLCGTCAPWAIGRYSTGREARGPRAAKCVRGDHDLSKPVPPTCRGVGAVEPRPATRGRARPALAHNTTTPSPHCAARVLHGRSVETPQGEKRAGRASRNSYTVSATF